MSKKGVCPCRYCGRFPALVRRHGRNYLRALVIQIPIQRIAWQIARTRKGHPLPRETKPHSHSPVARAFDLNGGVTPILATVSWAPVVQTAIGAVAAIAGGAFVQSFTR